jgi:hypothetical protein
MGISANGWFRHPRFWWIVYLLAAVVAAAQAFITTSSDGAFTSYNNFDIFTASFRHLWKGQDLYANYPEEHWDLFKYSPTFALFMAPFSLVGPGLGLVLWNMMNVVVPLSALQQLPSLSIKSRVFLLAFVFIEMLTSLQNEQSNGLVAGCMLWAFACLEHRKWQWAGAMVALCVFTKVLGLAVLVMFIFYPGKWKATVSFAVSCLLLFLLPLPVTGWLGLLDQYTSWFHLLQNDHSLPNTYSVMSVLNRWFGLAWIASHVQLAGAFMMAAAGMLFLRFHRDVDRYLLFSALLIWVVLFNHKAESPTFVIAAFGIGLWYVKSRRREWDTALVVFAFLFTVLSATDVFPSWLRKGFFEEYGIKAVPAFIVWLWTMTLLVLSWRTQLISRRE